MTVQFEAPGEISPRETQNGSDLCAGGTRTDPGRLLAAKLNL